jgi:hypothetical protein
MNTPTTTSNSNENALWMEFALKTHQNALRIRIQKDILARKFTHEKQKVEYLCGVKDKFNIVQKQLIESESRNFVLEKKLAEANRMISIQQGKIVKAEEKDQEILRLLREIQEKESLILAYHEHFQSLVNACLTEKVKVKEIKSLVKFDNNVQEKRDFRNDECFKRFAGNNNAIVTKSAKKRNIWPIRTGILGIQVFLYDTGKFNDAR